MSQSAFLCHDSLSTAPHCAAATHPSLLCSPHTLAANVCSPVYKPSTPHSTCPHICCSHSIATSVSPHCFAPFSAASCTPPPHSDSRSTESSFHSTSPVIWHTRFCSDHFPTISVSNRRFPTAALSSCSSTALSSCSISRIPRDSLLPWTHSTSSKQRSSWIPQRVRPSIPALAASPNAPVSAHPRIPSPFSLIVSWCNDSAVSRLTALAPNW
mmetsp:Transcript_24549/g.38878  ORF Transcript_24549/g.38878 Transcript_24549/m.38878 type:complete len:213 (+) Transcript_24549:258-896(+)